MHNKILTHVTIGISGFRLDNGGKLYGTPEIIQSFVNSTVNLGRVLLCEMTFFMTFRRLLAFQRQCCIV